jgi:hypothetical protein
LPDCGADQCAPAPGDRAKEARQIPEQKARRRRTRA